MEIYGYARVSSTDQNEERQLIALKRQNIAAENTLRMLVRKYSK